MGERSEGCQLMDSRSHLLRCQMTTTRICDNLVRIVVVLGEGCTCEPVRPPWVGGWASDISRLSRRACSAIGLFTAYTMDAEDGMNGMRLVVNWENRA